MRTYKVWFNDPDQMKNHSVKVNAMGIIPAIENATEQVISKKWFKLGLDIWKVELV
jgi:hypothetical protein